MTEKKSSKITDVSGAKLVLDSLADHGITHIFSVPGREAEGVLFNETPDLKMILTATEFTAGFAAYAYSIMSGTTQAVFSTLGPGAANLANAIYSAYADRVAVLFITAQVEQEIRYYNHTHQCVDTVKMYDSVTKFAYEINDIKEVRDIISKAIEITQTEPKGPALISVPIDILKEKIPYEENHIVTASDKTIGLDSNMAAIDNVASVLENAKQPLIFVGNEVIRSGSTSLIRQLCETYNLPVVFAFDSKGILPDDHALNYFTCSSYAKGILDVNVDEIIFTPVDCVIAFGYDWKDQVYPNKQFSCGTDKTLISFSGAMPDEISPFFTQIQGDLKTNLEFLLDKLAERYLPPKKLYDITPIKDAIRRKLSSLESLEGGVNIISIINLINDTSAMLVADIGTFRQYAVLFSKPKTPKHFLTSAGSSSFGTGLSMGLGVRLANPDPQTKIVVLAGDGGFNASAGDLRTCKNLDLDIVVIVVNNNKNGLIGIYQENGHGQTYPPAFDHAGASFVTIAEGYRCRGFEASSIEELRNKLEHAFEIGGTVVIEVPVYYPREDVKRLTKGITVTD
ncbi:MAG: thiamine pyrophosphate-binding protein [Cyanobacteria bacterium P01_G01_bin.54]